jgi:hypothetical protein
MRNLERFRDTLQRAFSAIVLPIVEVDPEEPPEIAMRRFLGLSDRLMDPHDDLGRAALPISQLGQAVSEIEASYRSLLVAEEYIQQLPSGNTNITRSQHLRYVVETWLNEVYILKERLKRFLQVLEELFAKGARRKTVKQITQPQFTHNTRVFEQLTSIRSYHIHRARYNDKELGNLEFLEQTLDMPAAGPLRHSLAGHIDELYVAIRDKRVQELGSRNQAIAEMLDEFFSTIYPIVFDEDGAIYPT